MQIQIHLKCNNIGGMYLIVMKIILQYKIQNVVFLKSNMTDKYVKYDWLGDIMRIKPVFLGVSLTFMGIDLQRSGF